MRRLILQNRVFFTGFAALLLLGGALLVVIEHGDAIWFFSAGRTIYADSFFRAWTRVVEIPTYLLLLVAFLFIRIRHSIAIAVTGILVTVVGLGAKAFFARNRPVSYFDELNLLEKIKLVEGYGLDVLYTGATSFPSGHTLSAFALCGYLAFVAPRKGWVGALLLCAAFLVGLSRIYLVQHFLEDVYAGALLGVLLAMIIHEIQRRFPQDEGRWWNRRLRR